MQIKTIMFALTATVLSFGTVTAQETRNFISVEEKKESAEKMNKMREDFKMRGEKRDKDFKDRKERRKDKRMDRMKSKSPMCAALLEEGKMERKDFRKCRKAEKSEKKMKRYCDKDPKLAFCAAKK